MVATLSTPKSRKTSSEMTPLLSEHSKLLFWPKNNTVAYPHFPFSTKAIEYELNKRWKFVIKDSEAQKDIFALFTEEMMKALDGRPDLQKALIPDFAVGCRRLTPAPGFLKAL